VKLHDLESIMVRFSQLILEQKEVKELDINPLFVSSEQVIALDARALIYEKSEGSLPQSAICPYPTQYVESWKMKDGTPVTIRPILPEDESKLYKFYRSLTEEDVHLLQPAQMSEQVLRDRFSRLCFKDYQQEIVLVAEREDDRSKERDILAIAQLSRVLNKSEARFSVLVGDQYRGFGLGSELLSKSLAFDRTQDLKRIVAYMSPDNDAMKQICKKLGFQFDHPRDDGYIKATMTLD
jgi:acetyltransferase